MKKILFAFLISLLFVQTISAVSMKEDADVFTYNDALEAFCNKNYGRSLKLCEDAVLQRKQKMLAQIKVIEDAVEPLEVKKAGDRLTDVKAVLLSRDEYEAVRLIEFYERKKGEDFFENSLNKVLLYLESIIVYPEAQKLMGDVYKIEGEYEFAELYYREALKNAQVLDVPDEKYDILYLLAEISALENRPEELEVRLLSILADDKVYGDRAFVRSMTRTIRQNKKDSLNKYINLYRSESYYMMKAYSQLAEYYLDVEDLEKALTFSGLHVITGLTKIISIIEKRNINFEYKGLESVLFECSLYPDLVQWGTDNELWKGFYDFAVIARKNDCYLFANSLLNVLAEYCPEEYYRKASVLLLK